MSLIPQALIKDILQDRVLLKIDILGMDSSLLGYLIPLTRKALNDSDLIEYLTKWRNQARKYYLTQFEASVERTRKWIDNLLLKDTSRLLFIITSPTKVVGHFGFKGLSENSVELDNLVRGEIGGDPNLIYFSECALISWLFKTFPISQITASVLSYNWVALKLHESLGFNQSEMTPLQEVRVDNEIHFIPLPFNRLPSKEGLFMKKLYLDRKKFKPMKEFV